MNADFEALLRHNVPRFGKCIRARGGVQQQEWDWLVYGREDISPDENESTKWAREWADTKSKDRRLPLYLVEILMFADSLLLYPKDKETFDNSINILVKAIAIMAFVPGGVRLFGSHFTHEADDFLGVDCD